VNFFATTVCLAHVTMSSVTEKHHIYRRNRNITVVALFTIFLHFDFSTTVGLVEVILLNSGESLKQEVHKPDF